MPGYFEQLDQAAVEAPSRRPVKVAPIKRTPTATSTTPRVRKPAILPCPRCEHPTRASGIPIDRAPGTRQRRGGTCVRCYEAEHPSTPRNGRIGRGVRVSTDEVDAWITAYQRGQSIRSIAEDAGRPSITVTDHLVKAGVHVRGGVR